MNINFSYAIVLHRVFDSAPPETVPVFVSGGRRLNPHHKAGGIYAFTDEPEQQIAVICAGYQTGQTEAKQGDVYHICLYPSIGYQPPAGWKMVSGCAPPGDLLFWPDERYVVRLQDFDAHALTVKLRTKPGLVGGCLGFGKETGVGIALILEKKPPDLFYICPLKGDDIGGPIQKGYAARADSAGVYTVAVPVGFEIEAI